MSFSEIRSQMHICQGFGFVKTVGQRNQCSLIAVHDRYPSQIRAEQFEKIRTGLNGFRWGTL